MDLNKLMQQAAQMQEQVMKAQQEAVNEVVEGSAGGVVTVKASGAGKIVEVKIDRSAIDPDDPELLEDLVLAAVNSALEAAEALMQSKVGGVIPGELGGLLPGM